MVWTVPLPRPARSASRVAHLWKFIEKEAKAQGVKYADVIRDAAYVGFKKMGWTPKE